MRVTLYNIVSTIDAATDPATDGFSIPGFFTTNFESVGGWSLFIGLCLFIVFGSFREWWVPGARYRRLEEAAKLQSETLSTTAATLEKQVTANEITKYFFEETAPKRNRETDT